MTTLYLIYRYMKDVNPFFDDPAFNLIYETRDNSEAFLQSVDLSRREENIDFWFIANAYETIKKWFEEDKQIRVLHIYEYFKEDVKIIWYEVGENEDAIALFTRLNIGNRIEIYDFEHSTNEDRYNTIGMVDNVLFVVYTERNENIRLIFARRATALERSIYYDKDSHFK